VRRSVLSITFAKMDRGYFWNRFFVSVHVGKVPARLRKPPVTKNKNYDSAHAEVARLDQSGAFEKPADDSQGSAHATDKVVLIAVYRLLYCLCDLTASLKGVLSVC
jgi:hypothetical protein